MTGRERLGMAMRLGRPDRVPVMCQLALGHYFLHAGLDPVEIWHDSQAFAEALVTLQRRYGFDGILVNLPGRDPRWRDAVREVTAAGPDRIVTWGNGSRTVVPPDDNPHVYRPDGTRFAPAFDRIDPERLFYVEPHEAAGLTYPQSWGFTGEPAEPGPRFFPPWHFDTVKAVRALAGEAVSVHAEIFSPFSQWLELVAHADALMALIDDPGKVDACLARLAEGAAALAIGQVEAGADAVLMSSAFAGAGFISRAHYRRFVLPHERAVIAAVKARHDVPIYTHTCGAIGDRLDLMAETGTNGIDTLDPPPLGTVDFAEARRLTRGRLFLKGNLDPVHTLLEGTREDVLAAARERLAIAAPGDGYVLSTACSVAPHTPPDHVAALLEASLASAAAQA